MPQCKRMLECNNTVDLIHLGIRDLNACSEELELFQLKLFNKIYVKENIFMNSSVMFTSISIVSVKCR